MAYNDQIVDQVQSLNDIVEVISAYIPLKRAGRSFKANCPFHQEKTPSFIVNPEKQIFHCFGCGVGGDIFSFLMKYEQMNFPEALRRLAERVHVTLPEAKQSSPRERSQTERLYQIYAASAEFYHANLKHSELGKIARAYLAKRAFDAPETVNQFCIGFALTEWRTLYEHLSKKGFQEQELIRSGLIVRNAQGKTYDLFRNRIMFPILNRQGKVIAFGGRVLGDELPKYINSPESPIFRKRSELYSLYLAARAMAASEIRRVLIVEGYLDCIRLHTNGFPNTVATLGTSLTQEHVQILKRYADEAIVLFDGDKAGEQASLRGLDIFLEEGMSVKVLCLPKGFDPDDFVHAKGMEAMNHLIHEGQDVFDFKLQVLLQRYNKSDSLGLLKITSELLDTFVRIKSPVLVDRYLKRLAVTLGVEEGSLRSELNKLKNKQSSLHVRQAELKSKSSTPQTKKVEPAAEKLLLALMIHCPPYIRTFLELFPGYSFLGEKTREIFYSFCRMAQNEDDTKLSASKLLNRLKSEELKTFASELLMIEWTSNDDREQAFQDAIRTLKKQEHEIQLRTLRQQISKAEEAGDQESLLKYMKAYQELLGQVESR
ncbi:MAG: DNA primase [Omnitrophica bacterium RIFCSPHIGHO2_02_FULL_46_11]|nr:MAG: DNA primase [Omnitrophica bacterium RIFCSPLOWO2_01_FULL_45_10b]OGW86871.1 MAG: DNA primase [Omnitrophica bacterium RIFCSPHIGHO2_02_FULL_46_11]